MPFPTINTKGRSFFSMTTNCPKCANPVEIDSDWNGKTVECPYCQERFVIKSMSDSSFSENRDNRVGRPKMLWAGLVWLYVLFAMSIVGNLLAEKVAIESIVMGCLMLWGVYRIQQGSNIARLTITIIISVMTVFLSLRIKMVGLILMLMFIVPVIFLWLPQCNKWFKEQ